MNRAGLGWTAALLVGLFAAGALLSRGEWPSSKSPLDCAPGEEIAADPSAHPPVLRCILKGQGNPVSAGAALTLGLKLKLNALSEDEMSLLPGVGPKLAKALVETRQRLGQFRTWEEVDAVPGVGPAVLQDLRQHAEILP